MAKLTNIERDIIEHFKRQHIAAVGEDALEDIYRKGIMQIFGDGARDPHISMNWKAAFSQNKCPFCPGRLSLAKDGYICSECSVFIGIANYDRGKNAFDEQTAIFQAEKEIKKRIDDEGIKPHQLDSLYSIAQREVDEDITNMIKAKKKLNEETNKKGSSLESNAKRWRGVDER